MICASCARTHDGGTDRCLFGVLLVCGGRHYADRERAFAVLDRVALRMVITMVRHGACKTGADNLADQWARSRGYEVDPMPAKWQRGIYSAGPIRNSEMAAKIPRPSAGVAFPGGDGTADMVRKLKRAGIPVWEIPPIPGQRR